MIDKTTQEVGNEIQSVYKKTSSNYDMRFINSLRR